MNQRENGGIWNHLGTFSFAAGTSGNIVLTDEADGYVIADAVKLVPENSTEHNSVTWWTDIPEAGNYKVYARWTAHPNRATNAKYSINYDGGSETVVVNQQENGGEWNLLGTFYFAADNSGSITLTDEANGYVIADAVMLRRVYQEGGAEKISVYFYHNDHLGTPQVMTDESGTVAWRADYMPFGHADVIVGAIDNNFRLPGQYQDSETGLHYNWHRYYDPGIGRYLRTDPYKGNISEPATLLTYPYCLSNPIVNVDREGLLCEPLCVPFWKSSILEDIVCSEKDTWLSGADFLCYYMTRQRDFIRKLTETKYICIYFEVGKCGECEFDTVRIKTGKDWHEEWTGWRIIERFTARPISRYMGHTGPVTVCPPRGPNYKGATPSITP